tara:strand:+ start:2526 stop:2981 length:456 start_codon:yes stop_codon:yes gene_type:complete
MAKFYSGQDGKLFVANGVNTIDTAADEIAKVRSWSFTVNTSVLETVSLGDFDRTLISGITSTTGSCSIYYYADDVTSENNANNLSPRIISKILPDTSGERPKVRFRLQVDANHRIDIDAVITSFAMTNSVGEVMSADVSFEADGKPSSMKF